MDEQTKNSPQSLYSPLDLQNGLQAPVAAQGVAIPLAADRMYQLAALTAGIFLLVTLL